MNRPSQPLLFLAAVVGLWTVGRIAALAPDWGAGGAQPEARLAERSVGPGSAAPLAERPGVISADATPRAREFLAISPVRYRAEQRWTTPSLPLRLGFRRADQPRDGAAPAIASFAATDVLTGSRGRPDSAPLPSPAAPVSALAPFAPSLATRAGPDRLGGSAWLLVRSDVRGTGLAPGGTLGGSQAGLRMTYRLNDDAERPLALSARVYAPLARPSGSEAAIGVDWRPVAGVPVHILAERRQAIGREGRSDFALTLYGGVDRQLAGDRLRLQAYSQAGVVGTRDLFADGAARLTTRVGPVDLGGGVWGGAQPGVERVDVGPHASARLPVGRTGVTVAAEWRFRIAGDAAPASGPALTLATDF